MTTLLAQLIGPLLKYLPDITEAARILVDRDTRKDNDTKPSTSIAKVGIGAAGVLFIDPDTPPDVAIITLIASLGLYFYRRQMQGE